MATFLRSDQSGLAKFEHDFLARREENSSGGSEPHKDPSQFEKHDEILGHRGQRVLD